MPDCFSLTRKGESEPASLQAIDDEMRIAFEEAPDAEHWLWGWYDSLGFGLALGWGWDEMRKQFGPDEDEEMDDADSGSVYRHRMLAMINWLEANYTVNSWAEVGRR